MSSSLSGQTIVIVGGTSGLGFATAKASILNQAQHVIVASSSQEKVQRAVGRLQEEVTAAVNLGKLTEAGKITGEVLDAKDLSAVKAFCERIGEIDHLVWTAGDPISIFEYPHDLEAAKDAWNVRLWSPFQAAQSAKVRTGGSITFTNGSSFKRPVQGWSLAAAGWGAVDGITRGLAVQLAPTRVNAVSPGLVSTELTEQLVESLKAFGDMEKKLLVGHIGTPDEVAEAYLFLMKCNYITGKRIDVEGGSFLV